MICPEYDVLETFEKSIYIGQIVHAVQNDSEFFKRGIELIDLAASKGLFDKVKFHPLQETINIDNNEPASI